MFNDLLKNKKKRVSYKIALCAFDENDLLTRVDFNTKISPDIRKDCTSMFGLDLKEEIIDILKFELTADIEKSKMLKKFVNSVLNENN